MVQGGQTAETSWPVGGGEMGARIRAFDWAATPLGPLGDWPERLRFAVEMIVDSPFPMAIVWGRALTTIYNEAFRPLLGEEAEAFGRGFDAIWRQAWAEISPLAARALGGEAVFIEDFPLVVERGNGPEEAAFTFSYSPLRDEAGAVAGFLATVIETTGRRRAETALRESEARLRQATDAAGLYTWDYDLRTRQTTFSANAARVIGAPVPTAPEQITAYTHPDDRMHIGEMARRSLEEGFDTFEYEFRSVAVPGDTRHFHVWCANIRDGEGSPIRRLGISQDVTARRSTEAALRTNEARQVLLLDIVDALRSLVDADEIQRVAARLVGEHLGVANANFARLEVDEGDAYYVARGSYAAPGRRSVDGRYRLADFPGVTGTLRAGRAMIVPDVATAPELRAEDRASYTANDIAAFVMVPLVKDGLLAAIFAAHGPQPRAWTAADIALIGEVGERTWDAIERARAEAELRASEARQTFLLGFGDTLRSLTDELTILQTASHLLGEHLEVDRCFFGELLSEQNLAIMHPDFARGGLPSLAGRFALSDFRETVDALQTGRPFVLPDVANSALLSDQTRAAYLALGYAAFFSVPLFKHGRLDLNLSAVASGPRNWTAAEIRLTQEVAERTWTMVERARAETALRASEARQRFLLDLGDQIRAQGNADAVIAVATRALGEHLGASRIVYAEIDESEGLARIRVGWEAPGMPAHPPTLRLADFGGPLLDTLRTGQIVRFDDVGPAPPGRDDLAALDAIHIRAAISVPLVVGGRFVVNLNVHQDRPRSWTDEEVALAAEVAERTWAAVERARAEEALRRSEEQLRLATRTARFYAWEVDVATGRSRVSDNHVEVVGFGQPTDDALEQIRRLTLPEDAAALAAALEKTMRGEGDLHAAFRVRHPDTGETIWIEAHATLVAGSGRIPARVSGIAQNVTAQKRDEEELRANARRLRGQNEAFQAAIAGAPLGEALSMLTRLVEEETAGEARTAFYLADPDGARLHPIPGAGSMPESYLREVDRVAIGADSLGGGLATAAGGPVATPDVFAESIWEPWVHLAREYDFRGCCSFPIETRAGRPLGTFTLYFRTPRAAAPREMALAGVVTQAAAIIISRHAEARERARAEARSQAVIANLPGGAAFVVDGELRYRLAEGEVLRAAGYRPADFVGKTMMEAVGPALAAEQEPNYRRALAGEAFEVEHGEGERVYLTRGMPLRGADEVVEGVLALSFDITSRKRAEAALRTSEERQAFLLRLADALQPLADADAIEGETCRLLGEHLGTDRAFYCEFRTMEGVTLVRQDYVRGDVPSLRGSYPIADFAWMMELYGRGQPVAIADVWSAEVIPDAYRAASAAAHIAWIVVPLVREGTLVGTLCVADMRSRAWSPSEVELVRETAERLWATIERARAEAALRAALEEMEARVAERTIELRSLSRQLLGVRETEQRSLSRELHDQIGQLLTGLRLTLVGQPDAVRLDLARGIVDELQGRVRALVLDLRPATLDDLGLLPALEDQLRRYTAATGVAVDLRQAGLDERLDPQVETAAYRIAQEALTNVARHAGVDSATVQLVVDGGWLTVQVSDIGSGFESAAALTARSSAGLAGMRERAALLGGTLDVDSTLGGGTTVIAALPLKEQFSPLVDEEASDEHHHRAGG